MHTSISYDYKDIILAQELLPKFQRAILFGINQKSKARRESKFTILKEGNKLFNNIIVVYDNGIDRITYNYQSEINNNRRAGGNDPVLIIKGNGWGIDTLINISHETISHEIELLKNKSKICI